MARKHFFLLLTLPVLLTGLALAHYFGACAEAAPLRDMSFSTDAFRPAAQNTLPVLLDSSRSGRQQHFQSTERRTPFQAGYPDSAATLPAPPLFSCSGICSAKRSAKSGLSPFFRISVSLRKRAGPVSFS